MTVHVYYSNSIETLADKTAEILNSTGTPLGDTPIVITPNPHSKKWLQMRVARNNGICTGYRFFIPDEGLYEALKPGLFDSEKRTLLNPQILHLLMASEIEKNNNIPNITQYIQAENSHDSRSAVKRLWELSERFSRYFLEYEHYREDMLDMWLLNSNKTNSELEQEQRTLYSALFNNTDTINSTDQLNKTLKHHIDDFKLPEKDKVKKSLIVFGLSSMSPLYLKGLYCCASMYDIHLLQFSPCSEFWEDVTTPAEDRWNRIKFIAKKKNDSGEYLEEDPKENMLLKLWGVAGRETAKLLSMFETASLGNLEFIDHWLSTDPENTSLLATLQLMISRRINQPPGRIYVDQDRSLQIAACPSAIREVESVYNSIVTHCINDSSLSLTEIAIMVPEMEVYAPLIRSVFEREPRRLSWSMIDSSSLKESYVAQGLLDLLDTAQGTLTRQEVLTLLHNPCIMTAFNLNESSRDLWWTWIRDLEAYHSDNTSNENNKEPNLHSWQLAMERMRLGAIMINREGKDNNNFYSRLPFESLHTEEAEQTDQFYLFLESLIHVQKRLKSTPETAQSWIELIIWIIKRFIVIPPELPEEAYVLESFIPSLQHLHVLDNQTTKRKGLHLSPAYIVEFCKDQLNSISLSRGSYLSTGVNVSALIPKRQIPFKIVYILGMQEGTFPGEADLSSLNLLHTSRKIGDVSRPEANRYLFLETLMSVKEKLYISYVDRDTQKDAVFNPNSVINQLITFIESHMIGTQFKITNIPHSPYSELYVNHDERNCTWTDLIQYYNKNKRIPLVSFPEDQELLVINNEKSNHFNSLHNTSPEIEHLSDTERKEIIHIRELVDFLTDPAGSYMRDRCRIYGTDLYSAAQEDQEPLISSSYFETSTIINICRDYCNRIVDRVELPDYIQKQYTIGTLEGKTPTGLFGKLDLQRITERITNRIIGTEKITGLESLLASQSTATYVPLLQIGNRRKGESEAIRVDFLPAPGGLHHFQGHCEHLWIGEKSSHILVVSAATSFSYQQLLYPFITYLLGQCNKDILETYFPGELCYVTVSTDKELRTFKFSITEKKAKAYVKSLLEEYNNMNLECIPFKIILDTKETILSKTLTEAASLETKKDFRNKFMELLEFDAEAMFPKYYPPESVILARPPVPADVYDKAQKRIALFLESVTEEVAG